LALGIGVNAALFTIFNAISLRSLPAREPDQLVTVRGHSDPFARRNDPFFTYREYLDYRESNQVFSGLAACNAGMRAHPLELTGPADGSRPRFVTVKAVTENYFAVLGVEPMLGRSFLPEEVQAATPSVVVLSHRFWERYWHSDPNVLGKIQRENGHACSVVGVMGPEFLGDMPVPPAYWMPIAATGTDGQLELVGRLKPGVTSREAKADLDVIAQRRAQVNAKGRVKTAVELKPALRFLYIPLNPMTLAVLSPVLLGFAMVLMIACTNVTNLLLARGVTRQQEIGVRLTLGASRGRIIRQLLTENLLLCILGAAAGLVLALWTLQMLRPLVLSFVPAEFAPLTETFEALKLGVDGRVIGCTAALATIAALAAGLAPAVHASRANLISTLKDEGSAFGRRLRHSGLRSFLIVSQVAVCLVLLSCCGLLVRSLWRVQDQALGFAPERVLDVEVSWPGPRTAAVKRAWAREFATRVRALPGVAGVAFSQGGPLQGWGGMQRAIKDPAARAANAPLREVNHCRVSAGFFETFKIELRGRGFTPQEEADPHARVAVISEFIARQLWPGADALGRTIAVAEAANSDAYVEYRVVGVAHDVGDRWEGWQGAFAYLPLATSDGAGMFLRLADGVVAPPPVIMDFAVEAGVTVEFNRRIAKRAQERLLPFQGMAALSGALGGLALLMAAAGLYGVMAFSVTQRTREIGIRMALGAQAANIVRLFLRQGMRLVAIGAAIGLGGTILALLAFTKFWFGFGGMEAGNEIREAALDPIAYAAVTLLLATVALVACWLPARRATKFDPMVA
ncbi:MAG: ADOP family duplicated permease, partial [Opitutaceae bacterium]